MSFFSLPPLSFPDPFPTDTDIVPSLSFTLSFPDFTATVYPPLPPQTTTSRQTTLTATTASPSQVGPTIISINSTVSTRNSPSQSSCRSYFSYISHSSLSNSLKPSRPPSAPESSPASNVQSNPSSNIQSGNPSESSTSTATLAPTGKLSPSQPSTNILESNGAKAGVFSIVAIVALSFVIGIGALIYRRRKRKQSDSEHIEAMVGYAARAPIDGDDDYQSSHSQPSNTHYHSQKMTSEDMMHSFSSHLMRERQSEDLHIHLPSQLAHNSRPPEEYNPYREYQNPFVDHYTAPNNQLQSSGHEEQWVDNVSEESTHSEPPSPWPRLGELPTAFGSANSEVTLEIPRQALRVTNA